MATPGYFHAMRIPLKRGRLFTDSDTATSSEVVLVDEDMANRFWPQGDPVGKRLHLGGANFQDSWKTIVGVVATVKLYGLDRETRQAVYFPQTQQPSYEMYVVARRAQGSASIVPAMIREVHAIDPGVPVYDVASMTARLAKSLARKRFARPGLFRNSRAAKSRFCSIQPEYEIHSFV
jgi:hypothetical protein